MAQTDWQALITMAVIAILYLLAAITYFPFAAREFSGMLYTYCLRAARACSKCCRCCRRSSVEGFEENANPEDRAGGQREDKLVRQRLANLRCSYAIEVLHLWVHVCGVYALLAVFRNVNGLLTSGYIIGQPQLDGFQSTILGATFITAFVIRMFPWLMSEKTLWIVHSWYMGLIFCYCTYLAVTYGGSRFVINQSNFQLLNVIVGLVYPETLPNFFWNAAFAVVSSVALSQAAADFPGLQPAAAVSSSCLVLGFLSLVLWRFQQLQIFVVESELDAKGHLQAKATMEKVLSNMCDAVVELDGKLGIRRRCPKLAGLLFKRTSSSALKGQDFRGLTFDDADRERFVDFVTARTVPIEQENNIDSDERASSVYVKLRDATGTAVSVQLFHSCHDEPPDDICHILGIKEVQEEHRVGETAPQQGAPAPPQVPHESAPEEIGNQDAETVVSLASSCSQCTNQDGTAMLAPLIPEGEMLDHVSVLVDPVEMQTIACTVGFKSFTGPLVFKGAVKDFVGNFSQTFVSWVQNEVHGRLLDWQPEKFAIRLKPSVRTRPRFEFRADAHIIHARSNVRASEMGLDASADEQEYFLLCVLALRNIEERWLRPSRRRGQRSRIVKDGLLPRRYGITL